MASMRGRSKLLRPNGGACLSQESIDSQFGITPPDYRLPRSRSKHSGARKLPWSKNLGTVKTTTSRLIPTQRFLGLSNLPDDSDSRSSTINHETGHEFLSRWR